MLTDRQLLILQVIIDDFVRTAQPVGSRSIAKKEDVSYSPATIRNEMADLEDMGFLEKTHSSSGRVPSEKGYRFYVDHLMSPFQLTNPEIDHIRMLFKEKIYELEKVVQQSAHILSELTNYTSIVLGPQMYETKVKQIQIIPLTSETAVAIIVTDTGHVENRTFTMPAGINSSDIEKLVNILNERLKNIPLADLHDKIYKEVAGYLRKYVHNYENIMGILSDTFSVQQVEKLYFGGKTNMLSQPEFNDVEKVRRLMAMIEQEDLLYHMLRTDSKKGIHVKIGHENEHQSMQDCSLITATYSNGSVDLGTIAILGPTRMEYSKVIKLLDVFSRDLTKRLTALHQNR